MKEDMIYLIIPGLIPGLISIFIAILTYKGQKSTQREIEKMKHDFTVRRFYEERKRDERRELYETISRVCWSLHEKMKRVSLFISSNEKNLYPITLYYWFFDYDVLEKSVKVPVVDYYGVTEDERRQIDILCRSGVFPSDLKQFRKLDHELKSVEGIAVIRASPEIREMYSDLSEFSDIFLCLVFQKIYFLLIGSPNKTDSSARQSLIESLFIELEMRRKMYPLEDYDLESILEEFFEKLDQITEQMKKELFQTED